MSERHHRTTGTGTTMRGSGWLREAPANLMPAEWLKIRGRAALRQCLFLPPPASKIPLFAAIEHALTRRDTEAPDTERMQAAPRSSRRTTPMPRARAPRRADAFRQAMMFPAMPGLPGPDKPRRMNDVIAPHEGVMWANFQPPARTRSATPASPISPLVLGVLLIVAPPAGLAAVWSHAGYDRDAKWALTVSTMMFMALATVLLVTLSR